MVINDLTLGEMVIWDERVYPEILPSVVDTYGKGPFKIVGLRLSERQKDGCDSSVAPYIITISLDNGESHNFAGEWFRRP